MNDPWSTLIETLSGTPRKTPAGWPARTIHRMMDDAPLVVMPPKPLPPVRPPVLDPHRALASRAAG